MTKRTMTVATHKGQISFPGGVRDPEDTDAVANALREAREEIGLAEEQVEVAGELDDFATVTGFRVTPVVGFVDSEARFTLNPAEVEECFEAPLATFMDETKHRLVTETNAGYAFQYHRYDVDGRVVWGATAGIIQRFVTKLGAIGL